MCSYLNAVLSDIKLFQVTENALNFVVAMKQQQKNGISLTYLGKGTYKLFH